MTVLRSLAVFCGSSVGIDPVHRAAAEQLGQALAERKIRLVYGGGGIGLMGVLADAALAAGGEAVGVIPEHLLRLEVGHTGLSELITVATMHERKQRMFDLADGFAVLPGGLGSLDETFEILTWRLLHLHDKPIVVIDEAGYWQPLLALIDHAISAGFASETARDHFAVAEGVETALTLLAAAPAPTSEAHPERF